MPSQHFAMFFTNYFPLVSVELPVSFFRIFANSQIRNGKKLNYHPSSSKRSNFFFPNSVRVARADALLLLILSAAN